MQNGSRNSTSSVLVRAVRTDGQAFAELIAGNILQRPHGAPVVVLGYQVLSVQL